MNWLKYGGALLKALWIPHADDDPSAWRRTVAGTLCVLVFLVVFHQVAAVVGIESLRLQPVARADQVDAKIEAALEQVDDKIEPLREQLQTAVATTDAILRALYLPQVRQKVRERCLTTSGPERQRINTELDRIKAEYATLSGKKFGSEPTCDQV